VPCGRALNDCPSTAVDISVSMLIQSKVILFIGELFRLDQIYRDCENGRQYLHGGMKKGVRGAKNAVDPKCDLPPEASAYVWLH